MYTEKRVCIKLSNMTDLMTAKTETDVHRTAHIQYMSYHGYLHPRPPPAPLGPAPGRRPSTVLAQGAGVLRTLQGVWGSSSCSLGMIMVRELLLSIYGLQHTCKPPA